MQDTKEKIIDASITLFAQHGYTETSMRSIAQAVQIKPASIYNHFASKSEILDAIFAEYLAYSEGHAIRVEEVDHLDARTALYRMFYAFEPEVWLRMTSILKIVLHEQFRLSTAQQFMRGGMFSGNYQYVKSILDRLVQLEKIRPIPTDTYANLFMAVLVSSSIEAMHFPAEEYPQLEWGRNDVPISFLIDQIVDG